jgi:hypothetical protein
MSKPPSDSGLALAGQSPEQILEHEDGGAFLTSEGYIPPKSPPPPPAPSQIRKQETASMLPLGRTSTGKKVAATTPLPRQTVTRLFEHEPSVIILERTRRIHKRPYRSIRIPRALYERVVKRLTSSERKADVIFG